MRQPAQPGLGPEDAAVLHHRRRQLAADVGRVLALVPVAQGLELAGDPFVRAGRRLGHRGAAHVVGHGPAGAVAEDEQVDQRVGAQAVGAVDAHARALAGRVEARHDGVGGVDHDAAVDVRGHPAHGVVGRGLDGHRLGQRLDALVDAGEVGDVGQLLLDDLAAQVAHVEVHVVLAADAAAGPDLEHDRAADHVARGELLERRRVGLHEPLALVVEQVRALAARRLRQQDAQAHDAGGVELVELHVLQRHARPIRQRDAVAGQRVGVGGDAEHAPEAAGGQQHGGRAEDVQLAVGQPVRHDALRAGLWRAEQLHHVVLVEEQHARLEALLVERLQDHVARAVGRVAGAADRPLAEVPRVAAEAALVDPTVGGPVEGQAHVLQLDDPLDGLLGQDLRRVLVGQVVAALDRVVHVPLPVVLLLVAQGRAHATLGGAGMGAGGIELAEDGRAHAGPRQFQGRPQARPAGAHDEGRVDVLDGDPRPAGDLGHQSARTCAGSPTTTIVPSTKRSSASRYSPDIRAVRAPPLT